MRHCLQGVGEKRGDPPAEMVDMVCWWGATPRSVREIRGDHLNVLTIHFQHVARSNDPLPMFGARVHFLDTSGRPNFFFSGQGKWARRSSDEFLPLPGPNLGY